MGETKRKQESAYEAGAKALADTLIEVLSKWPGETIPVEDVKTAILSVTVEEPKIVLLN